MSDKEFGQERTTLDAVTTGTGTAYGFFRIADGFTAYIDWATSTTAGAVQFEAATTTTYAGTWAPLGPPIVFSGTAPNQQIFQYVGPIKAVRARVTTTVVGGTVTVTIYGR